MSVDCSKKLTKSGGRTKNSPVRRTQSEPAEPHLRQEGGYSNRTQEQAEKADRRRHRRRTTAVSFQIRLGSMLVPGNHVLMYHRPKNCKPQQLRAPGMGERDIYAIKSN
jgi:hypothetical protein